MFLRRKYPLASLIRSTCFQSFIIWGWIGISPCIGLDQGDKVPALILSTAKAKKIDLTKYASEKKKRNLLLLFFRTGTCGICVGQLQEIASVADKIESANAAILALSLDDAIIQSQTSEKINNRFEILLDPDAKTVNAFGVYNPDDKLSRPSVFLIGPGRKILYRYVGKAIHDRPSTATLLEMLRHYSGLLPVEEKRAVTATRPE
jgi:peroxiredoxin